MPARNSALTLEDTVRQIPAGVIDEVILCDNASRDDTVAIAESRPLSRRNRWIVMRVVARAQQI